MTSTEADKFVFRKEWIKLYPDWLTASTFDEGYAYCRFCKCRLKISSTGKSALALHDKTQKHERNKFISTGKSASSAILAPAPRTRSKLRRKVRNFGLASLPDINKHFTNNEDKLSKNNENKQSKNNKNKHAKNNENKHSKNKWKSKIIKKYKYNVRFPNGMKTLRVSLAKDCFIYPGSTFNTCAEEGEKCSDKNDCPTSVQNDDDSLVHPSKFLKTYQSDNQTNPEKGKTFFEADSPSFSSVKADVFEKVSQNHCLTVCEAADQSCSAQKNLVPSFSCPKIIAPRFHVPRSFSVSPRSNSFETAEHPLLITINCLVDDLRAVKVQFDADCHRILNEIDEFVKETSKYNVNFGEFEFLKTIFDQQPNFSMVSMFLMGVSICLKPEGSTPVSVGEEENASGSSVSDKVKNFLAELRLVKKNFDFICSNILLQLDELIRKSPSSYGEFEFLKPLMETNDFKSHFLFKMLSDNKDK